MKLNICDLTFSEHFCISILGWLYTVPLRLLLPNVFKRQLLLACLPEIYSNSFFVFFTCGFIDKANVVVLSIVLPERQLNLFERCVLAFTGYVVCPFRLVF